MKCILLSREEHFLDRGDSLKKCLVLGSAMQDNLEIVESHKIHILQAGHSINLINHALCIT